jgi:hypothetical protein
MADITKKHNTEIYNEPCCSFIYFCVIFFGDVHVAHLYIFLCYVFRDVHVAHLYISAQKYIKMSNMDITKTHSTEIYKDEQHGHHQKHNTEIYKDEQHGRCSSLYISVLCFLVMSMLLIFIYFCTMFFGDVHVAHLYIFLCYVVW